MGTSEIQRDSRITELIGPANGSSQPWFSALEDGSSWLVKFSGAGPGPESLLAEYVANRLGQLWNLPIPETKPVWLDSSVSRAGTDEFWDVLAASEGWNLGIRTIPGAVDLVPTARLLEATLESMLAFDLLLANWDRMAQSRNLLSDSSRRLWWIDHGSCRFLHNLHRRQPPTLPATHFLFDAEAEFHPARLPMLEEAAIRDLIESVPGEWLEMTGHDRAALAGDLFAYLRRALPGLAGPGGSA